MFLTPMVKMEEPATLMVAMTRSSVWNFGVSAGSYLQLGCFFLSEGCTPPLLIRHTRE